MASTKEVQKQRNKKANQWFADTFGDGVEGKLRLAAAYREAAQQLERDSDSFYDYITNKFDLPEDADKKTARIKIQSMLFADGDKRGILPNIREFATNRAKRELQLQAYLARGKMSWETAPEALKAKYTAQHANSPNKHLSLVAVFNAETAIAKEAAVKVAKSLQAIDALIQACGYDGTSEEFWKPSKKVESVDAIFEDAGAINLESAAISFDDLVASLGLTDDSSDDDEPISESETDEPETT